MIYIGQLLKTVTQTLFGNDPSARLFLGICLLFLAFPGVGLANAGTDNRPAIDFTPHTNHE